MADGVLGETARPAADDGEGRVGKRAEDAGELLAGELGQSFIGCVEKRLGRTAAKEGAEQAGSVGDAAGELLIDKGAGEKLPAGRRRDEEAETGGELEGLRVREGERDDDGRGGLEVEEVGCVRVERTEERSCVLRGGGDEELVEGEGLEVRAEVYAPVPVGAGDCVNGGVAADPRRRDVFDHSVDEALEAAAEGGEDGRRGGARDAGLESGDEGAVSALHGDELRHNGVDAEGFDVSAEDTREEGSGDAGEDLLAEVAAGEAGDAFVGCGSDLFKLGGASEFIVKRLPGGGAEEGRAIDGVEVGGDHHAHAVGHGLEAIVEKDVGLAGVVVGGEEVGLQAELDREIAGPGLFGDPAVGATFDGEAIAVGGFNDAAETGRGFEEGSFDVGAGAGELG